MKKIFVSVVLHGNHYRTKLISGLEDQPRSQVALVQLQRRPTEKELELIKLSVKAARSEIGAGSHW